MASSDHTHPSSHGPGANAETGQDTGHDTGQNTGLIRGVTLAGAVRLNVLDMIGVGPFITLPLIVIAMHGPQAMLGWIVGAGLAMCDGLVSAELAATFPAAGGSYEYLKQTYGPSRLGRMVSFLFIWQLTFSAPLSIASGCIGLSSYAGYLWPYLRTVLLQRHMSLPLPLVGNLEADILITPGTWLAMGCCLLAVFLLYRRITGISRLSKYLSAGVLLTVGWIIWAGISHFNSARAFDFPPAAFDPSAQFFLGLGAALLIASYDYWGYYNICFLAGEVKQPERTIPRAILISIVLVAAIYMLMNISVLGVIPWRGLEAQTSAEARGSLISVFMQQLYGGWAGKLVTVLIMWTAFSSVFSLLLGYSRVPYAAALDGNYFGFFARLHKRHQFPQISLLVLGFVAVCFCVLRLADLIAALVVIRILLQFLLQHIGLLLLRWKHPGMPRPFRMWLYPLPVLLASATFVFVLFSRPNFQKEMRYALVLLIAGLLLYLVRSWRRKEWPWAAPA